MNRILGLLFLALVGMPNLAHSDEPPPSPSWLPSVTRPCSLRKVQAELSRRYDAGVSIDAVLLDLRVVWSFAEVRTLDETLTRLAELTDCRILKREADGQRPRYSLVRKPNTTRREAAWRVEGFRRTLQALLRAADEEEQGKLNPAGYPSGIRRYLASRAPDFRLLRRLTVQQMNGLLAGETIGIAAATVPQQSLRDMVDRAYPVADPEDPPEVVERRREGALESITKHGLTLRIEEGFAGTQACLSLGFGRAGKGPLCLIGDEELGLPFIHVNPYRWLEQDGPAENTAPLSESLRRPLSADVTAPPRFEAVLLALARVAQIDVISDAYLARTASRSGAGTLQMQTVARKGTTVAAALDMLCRRHGYLWWERDGFVCLRARAWPSDMQNEPPDALLDGWTASLARRGSLGPDGVLLMTRLTSHQLNGLAQLGERPLYKALPHPYKPSLREFLALFATANPAARRQLLDRGMPLRPEQSTTMLLSPFQSGTGKGPVILRFAQQVSRNELTTPREWTVSLSLVRQWPDETSQMDFRFEIPRLADPFGSVSSGRAEK